jgi:acyl-CoA reductase-like NAD-dependent aldehyde dehydrogenase
MDSTTLLTGPLSDILPKSRRRQQAWADLPVRERLRPVRALRGLLAREWEGLCAAVSRDVGKPAEETLATEILPLAEACRFLEREARRLLAPRRVPRRLRPLWLWGQRDRVFRRPHGLVAIIGTWNYPLLLNGVQVLQALTAGNAVLWKPSEMAPASAAALTDLLRRAGFPDDLVRVLLATREAGRELAAADVDHVILTGSDETGRQLAEHLGGRLVSSTLELAGCDALFVLEDADVALAARAAWFGATLNRGQTCLAVRRAFVHESLYAAFEAELRPLAAASRPLSLLREVQARQAEELVRAAVADGARLLEAPAHGNGGMCPVQVLFDARPEMAVCQEASFAPLMAVVPFATVDEALRMHALCQFGLGASVFTRNPGSAVALAAALRVGSVAVNDVIAPTGHPATPFGGRGRSGWGVTQGAEGLLEMTVPQVVSVRRGRLRPHYGTESRLMGRDLLRGLLEWGHGATLSRRWRGLWRLVRALLGK